MAQGEALLDRYSDHFVLLVATAQIYAVILLVFICAGYGQNGFPVNTTFNGTPRWQNLGARKGGTNTPSVPLSRSFSCTRRAILSWRLKSRRADSGSGTERDFPPLPDCPIYINIACHRGAESQRPIQDRVLKWLTIKSRNIRTVK